MLKPHWSNVGQRKELGGVRPDPLYYKKWNNQEMHTANRCDRVSFKCACEGNRGDVKTQLCLGNRGRGNCNHHIYFPFERTEGETLPW